MPAKEFYDGITDLGDRAKVTALFQRLADFWVIRHIEKFRKLGGKAKGEASELWEFKSFQLRFLGMFRPGYQFVVSFGVRKKQDDHKPADLATAVRIMQEHDARGGYKS